MNAPPRPVASRILVADPDDDARAFYRAFLAQDDRDVVEAADGRDALVKALVRSPTLVITELVLPHLDGFALCEILRRNRATSDVPIIVVTGTTEAHDVEHAQQAGADVVLAKPSTAETIALEAGRLLDEGRALRARARAVVEKAASQNRRAKELLQASSRRRSRAAQTHRQTLTAADLPGVPPALRCPACHRSLRYEHSFVSGVNPRQAEQWDYFWCENGCGSFEYRERTRTLRPVGS